jgi:hypothetical protein
MGLKGNDGRSHSEYCDSPIKGIRWSNTMFFIQAATVATRVPDFVRSAILRHLGQRLKISLQDILHQIVMRRLANNGVPHLHRRTRTDAISLE